MNSKGQAHIALLIPSDPLAGRTTLDRAATSPTDWIVKEAVGFSVCLAGVDSVGPGTPPRSQVVRITPQRTQ
jgi:hypothetical protein